MNINTLCPFDGLPMEATNKPWIQRGEEFVTLRCLTNRHWFGVPVIDLDTTEPAPF